MAKGDKFYFENFAASTALSKDLGTRHRAGVGISEVSDAVVVIVSEETGNISIAYDFSLLRDVTSVELNGFLHEHLLRRNLEGDSDE